MKNKMNSLATGALAALLSLSTAGAMFGKPAFTRAHTASFEHRHHVREAHHAASLPPRSVSGVIPRALRGGNPLQMLNPAAPAEYGTAADGVSLDPEVPGQINGINLFSVSF
jgi:hypothetical protein